MSMELPVFWPLGKNIVSLSAVLEPMRNPVDLQTLLVAHALLALLFTLLLTGFFPREYISGRKSLIALVFALALFLPVLGMIGALLILLYYRRYRALGERAEFSSAPLPTFLEEAAGVAPGMGEGGAWTRLRTAGLPKNQRLKALMVVGNGSGTNTSRFLRLATGDTDDEIRLLAFNIFEKQEQKINRSITAALEGLKKSDSPADQAICCRNLAFAYWEMVYNALSQDELRIFFVEQAQKYTLRAIELGGPEPSIKLLLGRIYLHQGRIEEAAEAIAESLELGAPVEKAVPYLAELAFMRRDFAALRSYFARDSSLRFKAGIGPLARFWSGEYA